MIFTDSNDLIAKLKDKETVEQTKQFTHYYTSIRFGINNNQFDNSYVDGANDGGLDFVFQQDENSFYILQAKFTATPKKISFADIKDEVNKIFKTLLIDNTNKKAENFINAMKRNLTNTDAIITINWLTTNLLSDKAIEEAQELIESIKSKHNINAIIEFMPLDKEFIDRAIYDVNHHFVPQTGRKELLISHFIKDNDPRTSINSLICKAKITDILKWFKKQEDITKYLQKNVRGFIGGEDSNNTINSKIAKSFKDQPKYFFYKHNGIIIFVDSFRIKEKKVVLINPQIVNGGQTINSIYSIWDRNRVENDAEVLLRIYRQSYDDTETYERTIEIVSALNSQNKVLSSDLKSNDQIQVTVEKLLSKYDFVYLRKREKHAKSTPTKIKMVDIAKIYHCCLYKRPDIAIRSNVEALFEDIKIYNSIFNKNELNKLVNINHRIIQYLTAWSVYQNKNYYNYSSNLDHQYSKYSQFYILSDVYNKVWDWKQNNYSDDIEKWIGFIGSDNFKCLIKQYTKNIIFIIRNLISKDQDPHEFYRSKEAVDIFYKKSKSYKVDIFIKKEFDKYLKNFEE